MPAENSDKAHTSILVDCTASARSAQTRSRNGSRPRSRARARLITWPLPKAKRPTNSPSSVTSKTRNTQARSSPSCLIRRFPPSRSSSSSNPDGGTHLTGFRTALTRAINQYAKQNSLLKDKDPSLSGDDVREGLIAVLSVKLPNPRFESQTKVKLVNTEIDGIVNSTVY